MIKCPNQPMNKRIFSLARKFNAILEEVIAGDPCSHFLSVDIDCNIVFFDRICNLTQARKIEFWKSLDVQMKDFNRGKTDLEPHCPHSSHSSSKTSGLVRDYHQKPWTKGGWHDTKDYRAKYYR